MRVGVSLTTKLAASGARGEALRHARCAHVLAIHRSDRDRPLRSSAIQEAGKTTSPGPARGENKLGDHLNPDFARVVDLHVATLDLGRPEPCSATGALADVGGVEADLDPPDISEQRPCRPDAGTRAASVAYPRPARSLRIQ